jgi:hypothetical protein
VNCDTITEVKFHMDAYQGVGVTFEGIGIFQGDKALSAINCCSGNSIPSKIVSMKGVSIVGSLSKLS